MSGDEKKGNGKKKEGDEKKDQTPAKTEFPEWATATVSEGSKTGGMIPVNFQSFKAAYDFCNMMCQTGFLPQAVTTPGQAMAIAIFGQELGIPLMTSFRTIHVVNGKPGLAAEMMLTKFMQRGGTVEWGETSATKCEGLFISKGTPKGFNSMFSIEKAKTAGLASKQVWKNYPEDMLRARCISRGVRGSDPGAIGGSHSPEELGGDVLTDGTVIDVAAEAPVPKDVDLEAPMSAKTGEGQMAQDGTEAEQERPERAQEGQEQAQEAPDQVDAGEQAAEARDEEAAQREQELEDAAAAAPAKPSADDPDGLFG